MKIIFFGTPEYVIPIVEALNENFDLVGVVTAPPKPVGRKNKLKSSPVASFLEGPKWALKRLEVERLDQEVTGEIGELKPDLLVVASYGKIIPQQILDVAQYGAINIHPSMLPKYRGASPIQSAILNGDKQSGLTLIKMDSKMDHGPIIYQEKFALSEQDTFEHLSNKMFAQSAKILPDVIKDYVSGKIIPKTQDHEAATFCSILKKDAGYFDIANPPAPEILNRMIRAYFPWPTAWTRWDNKVVKLYPSDQLSVFSGQLSDLSSSVVSKSVIQTEKQITDKLSSDNRKLPPKASLAKGGKTDNRYLVQLEGKNPVPLADFLHGHPDFPLKALLLP